MSAISYKCPNCGGDLQFDPKTQRYQCKYCISSFDQVELKTSNSEAEKEGTYEQKDSGDALEYSCPSCGAEIVTDATTAATFCYYCHNPVVLKGRLSGTYKPDFVLPFKVDKNQAIEYFLEYMKKKKFIPKAFFSKDQIEKISGIYFPFWMYDCKVQGSLQAEATSIRIYRMGDTEFTETRFYDVERGGEIWFEDLTKNALKKGNRCLVEGVQPFGMEELKEFSMGYLSGFQAEKRDMEQQEFRQEIGEEIQSYANKLLKETITGYATVATKQISATQENEQWKYVLLPVWTLTYKGKDGKIYYYAMNGQTKQISGELPVDYMKLLLVSLMIAVPVLLLFLLGGYFIW